MRISRTRYILGFLTTSVADPGCLFRIPDPNFFHPGIRIFFIPEPQSKNLSILTPNKMVSKFSEIWFELFIPDPDPEFLPIPDPGVKKAPDPGSATLLKTWKSMKIIIGSLLNVTEPERWLWTRGTSCWFIVLFYDRSGRRGRTRAWSTGSSTPSPGPSPSGAGTMCSCAARTIATWSRRSTPCGPDRDVESRSFFRILRNRS